MIGALRADHRAMDVDHAFTMLQRAGYRVIRVTGDVRIDAHAARDGTCAGCGRRGLRLAAFARPGAIRHVALAWCPDCQESVEL